MMKILIVTCMIILIIGCKNEKTYSFVISFHHDQKEHFHDKILSYLELSGYVNKEISGVNSPRILETISHDGKLLNQSSTYTSKTADVGLLSLYPNNRLILSFMLKNQTYGYTSKEKDFLNGYCIFIKQYLKNGSKIKFIDYKPNEEIPSCNEFLEAGIATYENVNNP